MKKIKIIDMINLFDSFYKEESNIREITKNILDFVDFFEEDWEVYFIFEYKTYYSESYESKKEQKVSKRFFEDYEMSKNFVINLLKVKSNRFRILIITREKYDIVFERLFNSFDSIDQIEIYSKNLYLCRYLSDNVVYRNDSVVHTRESFVNNYRFQPNIYSVYFYFFFKQYLEIEVLNSVMLNFNQVQNFLHFSNYIKDFPQEVQNSISKLNKYVKSIFDINLNNEKFDLNYNTHFCENNIIQYNILLSSVGLFKDLAKQKNQEEEFFDIV